MKEETDLRTIDQNRAMWRLLTCFSQQLQWPVNGSMVHLSTEDWKDILTAAFKRERVRLALAWDNSGVVMLGLRTHRFKKDEMSEFIEFLHACAAERNVVVDEPQETL